MILLPHAKRIAHDSGRGMGLPGSGRAFSDVSIHKAHCTADLPMHLGGVVWAHQKGAGLSAAGARLRARLVELERYERMAA